ncbi:MAG: tRNA (adenine-N1)-methyltransferase [Candidatus Methanomethylophilus sp.]|nr:tRNA (adenine-N1)-methyltransferase [Methanomethylophilus sp.]MDD4222029.1 tRNA (adenine-N1)-methyltransferase [Methanomethylophilus sp.]MDD4669371.1 tRNA (adenine-N1)-methyltransferase [Methanomethylophilus sp.]
MVFQENETIYLEGEDGQRHWLRVSYGMIKAGGLGAIDGKRFRDLNDGDQLVIVGKKFWAYRPGVYELMNSLDRGAQIITPKDAAAILLECDIKAGDTVLEVGAGSGGLTTALLHTVAPIGHVHTLELKEQNAEKALKNVRRTGLDKYWSYQIGDAREAAVDLTADALTMDMPDPENALDNLGPHLRNGGRLCAYVPNANQLENVVLALRDKGYADVHSWEILERGMEVHPGGVRPSFEMLGHTGYLTFARKRAI